MYNKCTVKDAMGEEDNQEIDEQNETVYETLYD